MYKLALPLAPTTPNVYVSLASISRPPEAARLLRHAIALTPRDAEGYLRLAAALAPAPLGAAAPPADADALAALDVLESARALAPSDHRPRAELGRLRLALAASWARQVRSHAGACSPAGARARAHAHAWSWTHTNVSPATTTRRYTGQKWEQTAEGESVLVVMVELLDRNDALEKFESAGVC